MSHIFSQQQIRANHLLWLAIISAIIAELLAFYFLHLKLDAPAAEGAAVIISASLIGTLFYRFCRRDDEISLFSSVITLMICGSFAIENATYLGAYMGLPLVDKPLIAVDAALGFDWRSYVFWIDRHPQIAWLLDNAYNSCSLQFLVLLPFLFLCAPAQGQRLFIALYAAGMLCALFSGFFPAVGAYIYYDITATALPNMPTTARIHEPLLNALLHHTIDTIPYPGAGIVTFPSYHTAVAVLLMYAVWPYRFLRLIIVPLDLAVLLSTPFDGGHYLSDVLGGIAIAGAGMALAERLLPRYACWVLGPGHSVAENTSSS